MNPMLDPASYEKEDAAYRKLDDALKAIVPDPFDRYTLSMKIIDYGAACRIGAADRWSASWLRSLKCGDPYLVTPTPAPETGANTHPFADGCPIDNMDEPPESCRRCGKPFSDPIHSETR